MASQPLIKSYALIPDQDNNTYLRVLLEDGTAHYYQMNRQALARLIQTAASRITEMESS